MCLIAFAYKTHPKYDLILAANRDEFYARPTRKAQVWEQEGFPRIVAGKDLQAGGTWMGISQDGKWGALTNYRDPEWESQKKTTRGKIVIDYLKSDSGASSGIIELHHRNDDYVGFNVLFGDKDELFHYSNKNQNPVAIQPGIHGVSNALLNTSWPKLDAAKENLHSIISNTDFQKEDIFDMLTNQETARDQNLPDTGIPYKWEKAISSIFIQTETYGTRSSSILLIDKSGYMEFTERRYTPGTLQKLEEQTFYMK